MKPKPDDKAVLPGNVEIDRAALETAPPAPSPDVQTPADAAAPPAGDPPPSEPPVETVTYLTARPSEAFGASGRFVDLPPLSAEQPLADGDLTIPTPEQLARRL